MTSEDCNGNTLTEEEFLRFLETYYEHMELTKRIARFQWMDMSQLEGKGCGEIEGLLMQCYEQFVIIQPLDL